MINKVKILSTIFCTILFLLFLIGCETTSQGISTIDKVEKNSKTDSTTAFSIGYKEGLDLAIRICRNIYDTVNLIDDGTVIKVYHEGNFWTQGTAGALITPKLVKSNESSDLSGIIFEINSYGEGYNYSMVPSFMSSMFFKELDNLAEKENLSKIEIPNYFISEAKGESESLLNILPTDLNDFKRYIDNKDFLQKAEGLWKTSDGRYTLGIIYDKHDILNKYKAYVIESEVNGWNPGDIKCKWTNLDESKISMGEWYKANKLKESSVFKLEGNLIVPVANNQLGNIALVKIYPDETSNDNQGSGTGFTIGPNGTIVTAYHVIESSEDIEVLIPGFGYVKAEIIATDPANDIAILKTNSKTPNYLNISAYKSVNISDKIYTLGYPIASVLGDKPKYSEGVVNSLTGLENAASLMQISIPIQPGNSGGPVMNENNEVVGMVVSTAGVQAFYSLTGTIPQNINWAVKSDYIRLMTKTDSITETEYTNIDDVIKCICYIKVN